MTAISVGGKVLPAPDVYNIGQETVGSFERNANGNMVGDLVATKATLTVGWQMLDDAAYKAILKHVAPYFVEVEYFEPEGGRVVKQMFARPDGAKVALDGGGLWWRDVRCVFVER